MKKFSYQDYLEYQKQISKMQDSKLKANEKYIKSQNRINNPHDKIFRLYLDNKKEVVEIINRILKLKKKINKDEIEKYNSSYINERYQNRESDVVYKKKDQKIFFLIEHQTSIDYNMPKRILEYEIEIMNSCLDHKKKLKKDEKLPAVIPIVIYTGKRKWNVAKYIKECQEKLEGIEITGLGSYYIIDINEYSKKELEEDELFFSKLLLIEKAKTEDELVAVFALIISKAKNLRTKEELKKIIYYIYQEKIGKEKAEELIKKLNKGVGNMKLAVERMLDREYAERDRKSRKEAALTLAKKMLNEKIDIDLITKITGIKKEQIL